MEQAVKSPGNAKGFDRALMVSLFRAGQVARLDRLTSRDIGTEHVAPIKRPETWAEKVNKPVTVPVFDAFIGTVETCSGPVTMVTKWRVPFGWIDAQYGDFVQFSDGRVFHR